MIGIIAASEDELKPILGAMRIASSVEKALLKFHSGRIGNKDVVAVYSGVCKVNAAIAAQLLIDLFAPTKIYVTGVAGALDHTLQVGTTVLVRSVAHHDVDPRILTEYHPFMRSNWFTLVPDHEIQAIGDRLLVSDLITGEAFVTPSGKENIARSFNAPCVDMESAAFAQVCYANNVPLTILKTITDHTDDHGTRDFESNVEACSKICAKEVLRLIESE